MVLVSTLIAGQVAGDGRSDWLKGAQLLAVYLVLALSFFSARIAGFALTGSKPFPPSGRERISRD
jgi:hypothetical protein